MAERRHKRNSTANKSTAVMPLFADDQVIISTHKITCRKLCIN